MYKLFSDLDAAIAQQYKVPNAKLSMANIAPKLLTLKDCILTVPGELLCYSVHNALANFQASMTLPSSWMIKHSLTLSPTLFPSSPAR